MLFKQLLEADSCTYTYLIGCEETRRAILIDPELDTAQRDLQVLKDMGLTMMATLETHVHADHLASARRLKQRTDSLRGIPGAGAVRDRRHSAVGIG